MFSWLINNQSIIPKVNFEDIQYIIRNKKNYLLITTLSDKDCFIEGTISIKMEESIINKNLNNNEIKIIIYGRNTSDNSIINRYKQLLSLGFAKVYIYPGGLFEWLCLQDIYGKEEFPTTSEELDILKFKPLPKICKLNGYYLTD